jgi:hypothetical protein
MSAGTTLRRLLDRIAIARYRRSAVTKQIVADRAASDLDLARNGIQTRPVGAGPSAIGIPTGRSRRRTERDEERL